MNSESAASTFRDGEVKSTIEAANSAHAMDLPEDVIQDFTQRYIRRLEESKTAGFLTAFHPERFRFRRLATEYLFGPASRSLVEPEIRATVRVLLGRDPNDITGFVGTAERHVFYAPFQHLESCHRPKEAPTPTTAMQALHREITAGGTFEAALLCDVYRLLENAYLTHTDAELCILLNKACRLLRPFDKPVLMLHAKLDDSRMKVFRVASCIQNALAIPPSQELIDLYTALSDVLRTLRGIVSPGGSDQAMDYGRWPSMQAVYLQMFPALNCIRLNKPLASYLNGPVKQDSEELKPFREGTGVVLRWMDRLCTHYLGADLLLDAEQRARKMAYDIAGTTAAYREAKTTSWDNIDTALTGESIAKRISRAKTLTTLAKPISHALKRGRKYLAEAYFEDMAGLWIAQGYSRAELDEYVTRAIPAFRALFAPTMPRSQPEQARPRGKKRVRTQKGKPTRSR